MIFNFMRIGNEYCWRNDLGNRISSSEISIVRYGLGYYVFVVCKVVICSFLFFVSGWGLGLVVL